MAFDVQTLNELAKCGDCLSPNQKQNVLLYLLNGILENGTGGGGLHNFLSLTHPDTVPGPPTRGALVVGNATPDWESLPIGAANRVFRSDGVDATWSQLVLTTDVAGILPIANGGTNSGAALNNNRIMVSSGGAIVEAAALTDGQLLIGSTGAAPVAAGLTAGTNVTIGTGAGSITVNAVMPGGFTGFGNPTASVGLVVVNGVATTAMRSDAAPPLSQAIAPTWTGPHIFSPTAALAIQLNPFGAVAGNTSELRFLELAASGTNYTGFKAADAMAASEIYVLPDAAPSANRFLRAGAVAAGVSTLSWTQISLTADVTGILPVANGGTGTSTAFTQGSVIFAGAAGVFTQDNANFFFDNANNRLGLATAVPLYTLHVFGPGSFQYGFAAGALVLGADLNATTITVNSRKIGRVNMVSYDGGATNTFLFGGDFTTGANDIYFGGVTAGSQYAATAIHFFTGANQTTTGGIEKFTVNASGVQLPPTGAAAGNTGELRFLELAAGGTNYAGFKAADAMAASEIYVLPNAAPAGSRFLQAAAVAGGVSALSWAQVSLTADVTGILPVANGGSGTSIAFTQGSVIFAGAAGVYTEDNANLFYDDAANRLTVNQLSLPVATSATVGGIYFGALLMIHNFGTNNTFTGINAGNLTMTGTGNSFFGASAGGVNTTGVNNCFFGLSAGGANTTGGSNSFFGSTTGSSNTTGTGNSFYGPMSGAANTAGSFNSFFGLDSGKSNTTGGDSIFVGSSAGAANTTGSFNSFVGRLSGLVNTTGNENVFVGYNAGASNTTASDNSFFGTNTGAVSTGSANCFFGRRAGFANTTGSNNSFFGGNVGTANTSGSNNLLLGSQVAGSLTTGSNNIVIGYLIDIPLGTGSNQLSLGNLIFGTGIDGTAGVLSTGNIGIGVITPLAKFHVTNSAAATVATIIKAAAAQSANLTEWQSSAAVANTVINAAGNISIPTTTATVGIIFQGANPILHFFGTDNSFLGRASGNFTMSGANNTGIGSMTFSSNTTGSANAAIGTQALSSNTTGTNNIAVGVSSLGTNSTGFSNTAVGAQALFANTTGDNNSAIGLNAMQSNTTGIKNTAVGARALFTNTTGTLATAVGFEALVFNTTGPGNTAIGYRALYNNTTGQYCIGIGYEALFTHTTGEFNLAIGHQALFNNVSGVNNTIIGFQAGVNATGSNNLAIGFKAGDNLTTGATNIVIGYDIDSPTATNSNTITIGNLIFGAGVNGTGTTLSSGGVGIGVITPTAKLHLRAGTTAASTAPLKFNTGTSMTAAEAGAMEFTTDDLFFTITTGAARKRLLMADATAGLTSGKIPIATTNGRLIDLTASAAYTPTNVTTDRAYDANATNIDELADIVGTMISDLQSIGVLG